MKKNIFLFIIITSCLISCLKNETKEEQDTIVTQEEKADALLNDSNTITDSLYPTATIYAEQGTIVYDQPNKGGKETGIIPYQSNVDIIEHSKKFVSNIENNQNTYDRWLKIVYRSPGTQNTVSGYILDTKINYNHQKKIVVPQDTVLVKNEVEFLEALGSNKILLIDTDTLNLERYYDQLIAEDAMDEETEEQRYQFTGDGNLELIGYKNITLQSIGKPIQFIIENKLNDVLTFTDCSNFIIDGFNFYHKIKSGNCEGKVCVINKSTNGLFINSEFNGSGAIGAYIDNSSNISFNKSKFYNNSRSAITIDNSSDVSVKNSIIYDNDSYILIDINQESAAKQADKTPIKSVQLSNTMFIKNNTSTMLRLDTQYLADLPSKISFSDCMFRNNTLESFINFQKPKSYHTILFIGCEITHNESADEDFNFIYKQGSTDTITFDNSIIQNNQNANAFQVDTSKVRLKNTSINGVMYTNIAEATLDSIQ
ncbi:hypothetical protein GCM10022393_29210 [Aquimarina addita]|uniref:Right handed beta helix domain-containing protein n=1 Tax=Aquimarina addita TaxID=870485 RepID=A0ABP6UQT6_9FLAO